MTNRFTPELARALPGPAWLTERRAAAAAAFGAARLPSESDEDWRYGRIDELELDAFTPVFATAGRAAPADATGALLAELGEPAAVVSTRDGFVVDVVLGDAARAAGLRCAPAASLERPPARYGAVIGRAPDAFTHLAEAFGADAVVLSVPSGARIEEPIVVVHDLGEPGERRAVFPRSFVSLGEGAQASVVELTTSSDAALLSVPIAELDLAPGAHLAYHGIQLLGSGAWQLGYQVAQVARDAELSSFSAALGGDYARLVTRASLAGEGAASHLLAVYLGDRTQVEDFRTFQEHLAPRTRSDLVFEGAVTDSARSVYSGLITIAKGAVRADASQTNRNLVLSEGARADSVPNLEIEENDVRCSHASAVGPIDAEQRFYLESRGIPPEAAERLILLGFFDDLLGRAPEPGCARYLRGVVSARLAGRAFAGNLATSGTGTADR